VTRCYDCRVEGVVLFGHSGRCADCYDRYRKHQAELRQESQRCRELLAARIVHPAGRSPRHRAMDLWQQRRDPESGRNTA